MSDGPTFDEIFEVLSQASVGDPSARVAVPADPDLDHLPTRLAIAVNVLLDDLAHRAAALETQLSERTRAEHRYRALFEHGPLPKWVFDKTTLRFLAVNEAAVRHYGYSKAEFAAMTIMDIRPREDVEVVRTHLQQQQPIDDGSLWRHRKKDGSIITVEVYAGDIDFEGKTARFVTVHDVTERLASEEALRRTEEQLRQTQKMEAVGRLAGGIAHDFNNVLSVILSYATFLQEDLREGDPMRDDIAEIHAAGLRAAALTRQLLAFSRQQALQPRILDVNEVVGRLGNMLERLLGASIAITFLLEPRIGKVKVDESQLEQVVMNLAVNAGDAMPSGGRLTIETKNVDLDDDYARTHHDVQPGPYVMIAVTDTGVGIDRATQTRIFEPFFTTKDKGKGTGLGLATVFGIVKQSGGHIWLYSEPGKGTTFKVYLPRSVATTAAQTSTGQIPVVSRRGSETVLVVEDDDQVRTIAVGVLRRCGYVVLEASNGGEAFLIAEQHPATIHLLLTDVVLPRMSGRMIAERIQALRPSLKVLYMSGYTDDAVLQLGILQSDVHYLEKPITPEALAKRVREVLDGPRR